MRRPVISRKDFRRIWAAVLIVLVVNTVWSSGRLSYLQRHGVPSSATLLGYQRISQGRGSSSLFTDLQFQVRDMIVTATLSVKSPADQNPISRTTIGKTAQIPILYDPKSPTSVILNYGRRLSFHHPVLDFFWKFGFDIGLTTMIFVPLIATAEAKQRSCYAPRSWPGS